MTTHKWRARCTIIRFAKGFFRCVISASTARRNLLGFHQETFRKNRLNLGGHQIIESPAPSVSLLRQHNHSIFIQGWHDVVPVEQFVEIRPIALRQARCLRDIALGGLQ